MNPAIESVAIMIVMAFIIGFAIGVFAHNIYWEPEVIQPAISEARVFCMVDGSSYRITTWANGSITQRNNSGESIMYTVNCLEAEQ